MAQVIDMEYKHTPGPWFMADFAGMIAIQDGPYYEDNDLLDYSEHEEVENPISFEVAEANGKLMVTSPDLLEALDESNKMLDSILGLFGENMALTTKFGLKTQMTKNSSVIKKATE